MKTTHTGTIIGCDSRTPTNYARTVDLRETKNFWVTNSGTKYRKEDGRPAGSDWPMYRLELDTIQPKVTPL